MHDGTIRKFCILSAVACKFPLEVLQKKKTGGATTLPRFVASNVTPEEIMARIGAITLPPAVGILRRFKYFSGHKMEGTFVSPAPS